MAGSNISVVFQAFTEKFEQKTASAGKSIKGFATKAVAIGAGFLAARAGVSQFSEALSRLNKLAKISDSLQVSPDFLRGLDLAAGEAGESFEKAQDLIKEFNIRMGEARTGAGPAVDGLKLLGLTIEEFSKSSPEESFLKVAEALSKLDDPQVKIFAAGDIFGGVGEDLLSVLNQGEEGLKRFIEKARELGGPITREDLENVERSNNAITQMGKAFDGVIDQLTIHFSPLLEDMALGLTKLVGLVKEFGNEWKRIGKDIEFGFTQFLFDGLGSDIELGGPGFSPADKGIDKTKPVIDIAQPSIKSFANAAQAQGSAAFDQLNPDRPSSVQNKQLAALNNIDKNTEKTADKDPVNFIQNKIGN